MKKILIVLTGIIALTSCTQSKIGYVQTEKLIQDYKGTKLAEEKLKEKFDKPFAEFQKAENEFIAKVNKMSQKQKQRNYAKLQQEDAYIQQQKGQINRIYAQETQASLKTVSKEVNDFVKKYGKDHGYQFILGTAEVNGSVMYGDQKVDVTYDVLKVLNNQYIEPKEEGIKTETKEDIKKDIPKEEPKTTKKTTEPKK